MSKYPYGTDCNSMQNDIAELEEQLQALQDGMYLMSNILASAVSELEDIARGDSQAYADTLYNDLNKPWNARRAMTMKDAKQIAGRNAKELRKVWEFLDPMNK